MDSIDKFLKQYSYKFDKGYPDINNPRDKEMLFKFAYKLTEQKEEEKLEDKLIRIIRSSKLNDNELNAYIKSINNRGFKGDITNKLNNKGYTANSFKVGEKAMDYIIDKITDSEAEEFIKYQPKTFKS